MTAFDPRAARRAGVSGFRLPDAPMAMPVQELKLPSLVRALRPYFSAIAIWR